MVSTVSIKKLEGVHRSEKLQSILDQCVLLLLQQQQEQQDKEPQQDTPLVEEDSSSLSVDKSLSKEEATSMLQEFDQLLTPQKQKQQRQQSLLSHDDQPQRNDKIVQLQDAKTLVQQYNQDTKDGKQQQQQQLPWIPIPVIQAIQIILEDHQQQAAAVDGSSSKRAQDLLDQLEDALSHTRLMFTPPPPVPRDIPFEEMTPEQQAYQKRLERLRLKQEETKYSKLTHNLDSNKLVDDISGKSMTYAASVGLNMVVAPISFGVFMYWFGGTLLDWWLGIQFLEDASRQGHHHHNPVDIKKVLIGVISGVIMLFIEMTLFVIRTHEFEAHQRKKAERDKKKPTSQAFGHYTSNTPKTMTSK